MNRDAEPHGFRLVATFAGYVAPAHDGLQSRLVQPIVAARFLQLRFRRTAIGFDEHADQHTALLTVEGELDDISGSGQTAAAHDLCTGIPKTHQMHYEAKGAGHYGIFSGRRWRDMVYPVVKTFILSHQPKPAQEAAAAASTAPAVVAQPAVRAVKPAQAKTATKVVSKAVVPAAKAAPTKAVAKPATKAPVAAAKRKTPPRSA